jgi:hypothetical protein
MAAGRVGASGFVTAGGARAGLRSRIVQSPPPQAGPGWSGVAAARTTPKALGADIAAVGLALSSFKDDFSDNFTDPALWPNSFGTYSEVGGRARVSCDAGFNAYSSALTYRLAESSMYLRVYPPAAGGATTEAWTQVLIKQQTSGTDIGFEISPLSGNLTMFGRTGFFDAGAVVIPYDAAAHAWLRVREAGGNVFWDTSPDTLTWTNQRTLASPAWVNDPNLEFQLIAHRSDGTNDFAEYDNLNTPVNVVQGQASLAVSGGLSAAGAMASVGAASLAASAGLSATGTRAASGGASLAGAASLSAAGARAATSTAALAASASVSAAGSVGTPGSAALAASGSMSADGAVQKASSAAVAGSVSLSAAGQLGATAGAALSASVSMGASGVSGRALDGVLAGAAALSAGGSLSTTGAGSLSAAVTLQAAGQVAAAVVAGKARAAVGAGPSARRGIPAVAVARGGGGS